MASRYRAMLLLSKSYFYDTWIVICVSICNRTCVLISFIVCTLQKRRGQPPTHKPVFAVIYVRLPQDLAAESQPPLATQLVCNAILMGFTNSPTFCTIEHSKSHTGDLWHIEQDQALNL